MTISLQQIWTELHTLYAQIDLKLPAPPQTVKQQIRHLTQTQHRLETLQADITTRSRACMIASTYLTYLTLTQVIQTLIQDIVNLKHLAEEYPIDPEGTTACLQEMPKHTADLLTRLNPNYDTHKQFLTNFTKKLPPLHKTQPVLARH